MFADMKWYFTQKSNSLLQVRCHVVALESLPRHQLVVLDSAFASRRYQELEQLLQLGH